MFVVTASVSTASSLPNDTKRSSPRSRSAVGAHIGFPSVGDAVFLAARAVRDARGRVTDARRAAARQRRIPEGGRRGRAGAVSRARSPNTHVPGNSISGSCRGRQDAKAGSSSSRRFRRCYGFQLAARRDVAASCTASTELCAVPRRTSRTTRLHPRWSRNAILGEHDPAEIVLLEIDPQHQKTWPDFA